MLTKGKYGSSSSSFSYEVKMTCFTKDRLRVTNYREFFFHFEFYFLIWTFILTYSCLEVNFLLVLRLITVNFFVTFTPRHANPFLLLFFLLNSFVHFFSGKVKVCNLPQLDYGFNVWDGPCDLGNDLFYSLLGHFFFVRLTMNW